MSTPFEIAKKISFQKQKTYTRFIVRLSITATAISVAAIILTLSIVNGFQEAIANKVYDFWGHIRITSVSGAPIEDKITTLSLAPKVITHSTPFINQTSVLSYKQDIEGVVVKGVPAYEKISFLTKGKGLDINNNSSRTAIIISDALAAKLNIPLNATVRLYFMSNETVQQRKMTVTGFYHTGIEEYDRQFVVVDIKMLQQLNGDNQKIDGYTLKIKDANNAQAITDTIQKQLPNNWVANTVKDYYPQIFDWINVQTVNRNVTITILLIIAIVNLLTCLFILMLERVNMIGTLAAMGANNNFIRKIFLYQASFICWIGIAIGAGVGIGLSLLQMHFGWIQLDESAYFIKNMPIKIIPSEIILVILSTAFISYLSFLIPTLWIKKVAPAKAIKFD